MSERTVYGRGAWLRFYQAGRLVIGQVEYVERDLLGYTNYATDQGSVREDAVLEARSTPPTPEAP